MVTAEQINQMKQEGYDIYFNYDGDDFFTNSSTWNEEKAKLCFEKTGLMVFREETGLNNLVFYNPNEWEVAGNEMCSWLHYCGSTATPVQPFNVSSCFRMFYENEDNDTLNLSGWNMSGVVDMREMFKGCTSHLLIDGWKNSGINPEAKTDGMWDGCLAPKELMIF